MGDWLANRADVVADFQRFYGISLPVDEGAEIPDLARMALLWQALPDDARCVRRAVPAALWTSTDYLLRAIEHAVRVLVWQRTEDGAKGRNAPEPIKSPAERARAEARRDEALAAREEIDRILGIDGAGNDV